MHLPTLRCRAGGAGGGADEMTRKTLNAFRACGITEMIILCGAPIIGLGMLWTPPEPLTWKGAIVKTIIILELLAAVIFVICAGAAFALTLWDGLMRSDRDV